MTPRSVVAAAVAGVLTGTTGGKALAATAPLP
jgi:hypothetical protein